MAKYIFVTGGVVSSLGKGVTASSLGRLLKNRGLKVFMQKFDPYINVDPGLMDPCEHGEVFVTDDGAETDLDLGHYERFIDEPLSQNSSITTGRVYSSVIKREREGGYGGATVQVIPHITDEIKSKLVAAAEDSGADIVITEIGGTIGDIEGLPFLEAIRQARLDFGYKNTLYVHNTLVPYLKAASEIKTKPTQHSVKELLSLGIQPDVVVLRTEVEIEDSVKAKISRFCNVQKEAVIEARDAEVLYEVPIRLQEQGMDDLILDHFRMDVPPADMTTWNDLINTVKNLDGEVKIGIIGDYTELPDAYFSINEALRHAGYAFKKKAKISFISAESLKENTANQLSHLDGIILPYGEENQAEEGKLAAIKYARENGIPFFGIDQGMQLMTVEQANHVAKISTDNMITSLPEGAINKDGEWRTGSFETQLTAGSKIAEIYGATEIAERHRHRYALAGSSLTQLEVDGFSISGTSKKFGLIEAVERKNHPFFIGVGFHPQFLSRPQKPHPLFKEFIKAAIDKP
ncbi:MAG: CTP synthase [Turicibacter sp.]|nr:CTP synthase [Turicibacter sp.]